MKQIFEDLRSVPADALKAIQAGKLKGKSDINPVWRMMRLTEVLGSPCGFGWYYEITRQWLEQGENTTKAFCNINLYIKDPDTKEWSMPIPGTGGAEFISAPRNNSGQREDNDECFKMALTDALSVAMKALGVAADIYLGENGQNIRFDSKYAVAYDAAPNTQPAAPKANTTAPKVSKVTPAAPKASEPATTQPISEDPMVKQLAETFNFDEIAEPSGKEAAEIRKIIRSIKSQEDLIAYIEDMKKKSEHTKAPWFQTECKAKQKELKKAGLWK